MKYIRLLSKCILLGLSVNALPLPVSAQEYKGAACVVFVENEVLLVRDILSNRLSFPGGYLNPGEPPELAAQRETYEETGLVVTVGPQIGNENRSAQYLCRSISPIPVLTDHGFEAKKIVYALPAPDFSVEIRQVYLTDPKGLALKELRFPNQIGELPSFADYPEWQSRTALLAKGSLSISAMQAIELKGINQLQKWLAPQADPIFRLLNVVGESTLFFIIVPIIWAYASWQYGIRCLLLLILAADTTAALKLIFTQPRPFHLVPELQRMEAYGYAMPSGHALVATAFWTYCWLAFKHLVCAKNQRFYLIALVTLLLGGGLARVYWGVHFFSDVIVGIGFGLFILSLFFQLERSGLWQYMIAVKKSTWSVGLLALMAVAYFSPGMLSSEIMGLAVGLFLGLCIGNTSVLHEKITASKRGKLNLAALGIAGMVAFDHVGKTLATYQSDSIIVMALYVLSYMLIGLWLTVGMYLLLASRKNEI
jgi:membrane-associated phospholipid phosphatase